MDQPHPVTEQPIRWVSSVASSVGNREENQDAYWCPETFQSGEEAVFVVVDGMGGGQLGAWAAQSALREIVNVLHTSQCVGEPCSPSERLHEAVARANANVHALQQNLQSGWKQAQVGCAVAVGLLKHQSLTIAHVGDVRVYLWRQGQLTMLTKDHSWAVEFGEGTEMMRHVLSRALGPNDEVEPDIYSCSVDVGDVIVFCTDGVWAALPEEEMARIIAHASPKTLAARLVQAAHKRDASDNATALAIVVLPQKPYLNVKYFSILIFFSLLLLLVLTLLARNVGSFIFIAQDRDSTMHEMLLPSSRFTGVELPQPTATLAELLPRPTATLMNPPAVKVCPERDFNHSQGRCAYSVTDVPLQSPVYLSWEPPTIQLQRIEMKREGSRSAPREISFSSKPIGYVRLEVKDFGSRLQPGTIYVVRLHFAGFVSPAEVSFNFRQ